MKKKLLISLWLVLLAAFSRLPEIGYASSRATYLVTQPQVVAGPLTGSPGTFLATRSPSQNRDQLPESSSAPILHCDRLSAANGLSFSLVTSIIQDQQGFMWFGTLYGINKYDGFNFTTYIPQPSGDVLTGNFINDLFQDHTGDLWMATRDGLARMDRKIGTFVRYMHDSTDPQSLAQGRINTIAEDPGGTLWVGTHGGLNRFERSTGTFSRFLPNQPVLKIFFDSQGGAWLGTISGLWLYEAGLAQQQPPLIYRYDRSDTASLSSDVVTEIYEDYQGALWVGTSDDGLNRLDRATGQFTKYQHDPVDPQSLSDNSITSIMEEEPGRLWIGTENGLNLLDLGTDRFFQYYYDPNNPTSLNNSMVQDIYQDRSGVVWIATFTGICKVNETASKFTHYQQGPNQPDLQAGTQTGKLPGLSDQVVMSILQDQHGILWIGTSQGGLNRLDRSTGAVMVYRHDIPSLNSGEVNAIYEDQAGTFWIGTTDGLVHFDPGKELFEPEVSLQGRLISSIFEDQQGNLWVGYWGGILRRKPGVSSFTYVPVGKDTRITSRIQKTYLDQSGSLWISTQDAGLFRLDLAQGVDVSDATGGAELKIVHFPQDSNDPRSPGNSPVMSFYEDTPSEGGQGLSEKQRDVLWMGSMDDGLIRFDRDSQMFSHYIPKTGISRFVSCIQGDVQGYLWMGTKQGLARFDPRTEMFVYFDERDGLIVSEVLSCFQSQQGEMFFGGWSGLNTFFPDQIRDNTNPPAVVITTLNLKNQVLHTDLSPDEQIILTYKENYLSFDFAAMDYTAPAKNQYAYKMEGLEAEWIEAGTRRHADYPDLKPGTYTFRVKASNNSGVWNEQGVAVRITITSPFWQTWWFLGLLGVALAGVIAGGIRLRLKGLEARSHELEQQVDERTATLEQKTLELQLRTLEIERRRQELEALLGAEDRMQRYLHQDQVLQALVDVAVDLLQANKSAVFWWDEKREKLVTRVARGFSSQAIRQIQFTRGEGIVAGVVLSGEPALVEDSLTDPRRNLENPQNVQFALDENIRSFMFFPISIGDDVLGVFNVSFEKPHAAGAEEMRLFQALTQRAALHIENARLYEQSQELAVLEERSRLARELHDAVTQTLFSASLVAEALPATWEKNPHEGRSLLQELRGLSRGALAEMRTLLLELRPAALVETRLEDLLRQLGEAASGREGIPVNIQAEGLAELPPDVQIALYRITQEALNNVVKHARAHQVTVRLCYIGQDQAILLQKGGGEQPVASRLGVLLSISDDGRGFDPARIPHNRLGLGIMQERARAIGARITIESQPSHGTQVTVLWEQEVKQEAK